MKKETNINFTEVEKIIGYKFKDRSLLTQAFTRTSYCNEQHEENGVRRQSNEVLEFFGDGVLSVAIISFLLKECTERYEFGIKTDLGEGDFSNIKSKLSDKQNLSKSMKILGLHKYLKMGDGDKKLGIGNEPSVMEDLFESIVGAIYIDSDMSISAVIDSLSKMLDMSVYTSKDKPMQSSKNTLQEWCADKKRRLPAPRYETLSEDGPDHKKTYVRGCYIGEKLVGRGVGKNFKLADAAAADDALKALTAEKEAKETTKVSKIAITSSKTDSASSSKTKNNTAEITESRPSEQNNTAVKKNEPSDVKAPSARVALKTYKPKSASLSSLTYKDLGESVTAGKRVHRVECIVSGESVIGEGESRQAARINATVLMEKKLSAGKEKSKNSRPVQSDRTKPNRSRSKKQSGAKAKMQKTAPPDNKSNIGSDLKKHGKNSKELPARKKAKKQILKTK